MHWTIDPLRLGELEGVSKQILLGSDGQGMVPARIPIYSYLLRSSDGLRSVVFDLGPPPEAVAQADGRKTLVPGSYRGIVEALAGAGATPDEVEAVVLSHLHWDHIDGVEQFHRAKVYLQASEWAFAKHDVNPQRAFFPLILPAFPPERLVLLHGRQAIAPGLEIVPLPGHTPGSQGLVVQTTGGPFVCCGDLVYRFESLDGGPDGQPLPPGLCCDEQRWRESAGFVRLIGQALPAHDERIEASLRARRNAAIAGSVKLKETT